MTKELNAMGWWDKRSSYSSYQDFMAYPELYEMVTEDWSQYPETAGNYETTRIALGRNDFVGRSDMKVDLTPLQLSGEYVVLESHLQISDYLISSSLQKRHFITSSADGMLKCA